MSAGSIRKKIAAGMKKAVAAVGDGQVEFYLKRTDRAVSSLTEKSTPVDSHTKLSDAVLQPYNLSLINGTSIISGDRELVAQSDVELKQGDYIEERRLGMVVTQYVVIAIEDVSPIGATLIYRAQLRVQ